MITKKLIKNLGMFGVSMGLLASPLAFSDQVTLPPVFIIAEELASPSMYSDPVNDPRELMQAAYRGPITPNGAIAEYLPSFRSDPIIDPFMNGAN